MADATVSPHNHCTITFAGENANLLVKSVTAPTIQCDVAAYPTFDESGNPVNSLGGGTQVTYSDLTIERAVDTENFLGKWIMDVKQNGVTDDTKKQITLTINGTGAAGALRTLNLVDCVIVSHGVAAVDAQSGAVLTESTTIKVTEMKYEG